MFGELNKTRYYGNIKIRTLSRLFTVWVETN